jgi:hypothetical protein
MPTFRTFGFFGKEDDFCLWFNVLLVFHNYLSECRRAGRGARANRRTKKKKKKKLFIQATHSFL